MWHPSKRHPWNAVCSRVRQAAKKCFRKSNTKMFTSGSFAALLRKDPVINANWNGYGKLVAVSDVGSACSTAAIGKWRPGHCVLPVTAPWVVTRDGGIRQV